MFTEEEFKNIVSIYNKLEQNNSKINEIRSNLEKINPSDYLISFENQEIKDLKTDSKQILSSLDNKTLTNIIAIFSIGRVGINGSYEDKLDDIKHLANDKYFIEDKLININTGYLKKYFDKGFKYIKQHNLIIY